ncbi:tetratricopeptide repeat protein SKI3-like isoform X1 [Chenopodium quinoa]|uniref:tetratricopeptide repeat protein SKI3-like isoform X1 n=2 Tax=Chenopodium quinoa TaxID=63459 RepID=UPI000B78A6FB|nr:tetratricopeptide repeat protein SKI3-like isoform X1 [Chenopodium quinoa]
MNINMNVMEEIQLKTLEELADSHPDDPSHQFNLGKLIWERGEEWREKAAEHFLKAAKLNPQNGEAFRFLGHYYTCVCFDTQRALKCYQRAVTLNPDDSQSGEALCDLLDKSGKESLEIAVCREAFGKSPRAFWAFARLGLLMVHQNKWSEAVQSLQHAIRGYPTCADLWEALGLAYQRLGMYTAAIKSYGRAMELENSKAFAMIETGNIFLMLGSYRKGIEQFQHALEICPQSACAQYGLASGLLALSQECIKQGAYSWATSLLEEASEVAKNSAVLTSNMSCVWKLHADIQLTYAKSFPWTEGGNLKGEEAFSRSLLSWKKTRQIAAVSAKCSYQRALHLAPWQANIYMDVAVALDHVCSLQGSHETDLSSWKISEKMLLGSLLLESDNHEFWMALGCMSDHRALRQHAFIRGLHLDVSLASAWAYLGKLYKEEGESQLGRQAFDRARSIDPSLSLPWAGMSADTLIRETASDEAYDSCLRAVQILPLAEFQIGLAKLALRSNNLLSSEVFGSIRQALQCAPWYPESHNLNGLVSEARHDYQSAIVSYQLARYAWKTSTLSLSHSHFVDISINLARALCKAENVLEAVQELEDLKERGFLDVEGLQVYALSLWKLGKNDMSLSAAKDLATCVPTMKLSTAVASISLICCLLYSISGVGSTINNILQMPRELLQSAKVSFIISAVDAVDRSCQLQSLVSSSRRILSTQEEIMEMHLLIALSKLIRNGDGHSLSLQSGINHLRKALHMYPNGISIRNMLGYLLLSLKQWENDHVVRRCCAVVPFNSINQDFRSAHEIIGAEAVACHATYSCKPKYSLSTCKYQNAHGASLIGLMQRWLRLEPWNHNARYFLVLNLLQTACQAKCPQHLLNVLKRMTSVAVTSQLSLNKTFERYKRFQLLLCSSELNLLGGDMSSSVSLARDASNLSLSDANTFFAHLQLCRAHAAEDNQTSLNVEFTKCLKLKTNYPIGWISLKIIESRHRPQDGSTFLDSGFRDSIKEIKESENSWLAVYKLFCGLASQWAQDFLRAEEFLAEACSLAPTESCFFLCHGAICMELTKMQYGSQYLTMGIRSLKKAQGMSSIQLPFVSLLLAQAEASLGSKLKWDSNLQLEWYSWSPETRPAELYFQMHLLALGSGTTSSQDYGDPLNWVLRAIHLNPSCLRYWRVLRKLAE